MDPLLRFPFLVWAFQGSEAHCSGYFYDVQLGNICLCLNESHSVSNKNAWELPPPPRLPAPRRSPYVPQTGPNCNSRFPRRFITSLKQNTQGIINIRFTCDWLQIWKKYLRRKRPKLFTRNWRKFNQRKFNRNGWTSSLPSNRIYGCVPYIEVLIDSQEIRNSHNCRWYRKEKMTKYKKFMKKVKIQSSTVACVVKFCYALISAVKRRDILYSL